MAEIIISIAKDFIFEVSNIIIYLDNILYIIADVASYVIACTLALTILMVFL